MKSLLAATAALVLGLSSGVALADGDGLPLPPSRTARPAKDGLRRLTFETGSAKLVVSPDGNFTVTYPDPSFPMSRTLDWFGLAPTKTVSGTLTPAEKAGIDDRVESPDELRHMLGRNDAQVLSERPFSLELERTSDPEGDALRLENGGAPTRSYGLTDFADLLNGIVDRATGGYVYGTEPRKVEGTVGYRSNAKGHPVFTVTDDRGGVYELDEKLLANLHGPAVRRMSQEHWSDADSPAAQEAARKILGERVTVYGMPIRPDGSVATTLVLTRTAQPATAPVAAPPASQTRGLAASLDKAGR